MKRPDTAIPCAQCSGMGRKDGRECGACFGFGLSTAPWDQKRNGTTVTLWDNDPPRNLPPGTCFHGPGKQVERRRGLRLERGAIYLISWPNPNYRPLN